MAAAYRRRAIRQERTCETAHARFFCSLYTGSARYTGRGIAAGPRRSEQEVARVQVADVGAHQGQHVAAAAVDHDIATDLRHMVVLQVGKPGDRGQPAQIDIFGAGGGIEILDLVPVAAAA